MFLNIQIDLIILETYDQQFTLTTKKSLHIIFKALKETQSTDHNQEISHTALILSSSNTGLLK